MLRRPSTPIAGLMAIVAAIPFFGGCQNDPVKSSCVIETHEVAVAQKVSPGPTSLFLLPDARLDAVGSGFVLFGTEGRNVRWAVIGTDGAVAGDEQSYMLPEQVAEGPWFAAAGTSLPRDHVVVAYVPATAVKSGPVDLMIASVQIDGTNPGLPTSSGKITAGSRVAMVSGRGGMHAGVSWVRPGTSVVSARILGGDGLPVGADLLVGNVEDSSGLAFSPGKGDLTLGYVDLPTGLMTTFTAVEIDSAGSFEQFKLSIGKQPTAHPESVALVPTETGYGASWHSEGIGIFFSPYSPMTTELASFKVVLDTQQVVTTAGLGWLGKQYALVLQRASSAQIVPINARGEIQGVLPALPSRAGHIGAISTQPMGTDLYLTYADYESTDMASGSRLLLKVSCPQLP